MGFASLVSTTSISTTPTRFLLLGRQLHDCYQKPVFSPSFLPALFPRRCLHVMYVAEGSPTCISDLGDIEVDGDVPLPLPSPLVLAESVSSAVDMDAQRRLLEKMNRRRAERRTYLFAAVVSTVGITFLTVGAIYYRFAWQTQGTEVPLSEVFGTFSLAFGAAVGMEYWARWAHRALWHDSLWGMHESHHRPRDGPFELNDVFAIVNAIPAIALIAYGFFHKGLVPGLCFGAGLGITVFGIAYMFVHDGLVHRRFPVGPIADVPYFQKVAAAHQLHHADKFRGVPYGLFLGPQELVEVGGAEELEQMMQIRKKIYSPKDLIQ